MKELKIFISGKISGENIYDCINKFDDVQSEIETIFILNKLYVPNVINPLKLDGIYFGIPHSEAMKICLKILKKCDCIYMLKDWKFSKGAAIEHEFAKNNGIKIIYQS